MTLAQIYKLALRQLDMDIEDVAEYVELFRQYANEGNQIVVNNYWRPCEEMRLHSDEDGRVWLYGMDVHHVICVMDAYGRTLPFRTAPDGTYISVGEKNMELSLTCQKMARQMTDDNEEPPFPNENHFALVDYICYRQLVSGNAAKQSRARVFYDAFLLGCRRIVPQNTGSVKQMHGLYAASHIRARR